ncbi:hypothetical protein [Brevibacillus dissolubilis]|uniref:hypothetical protein n=1 Tax=Brevibacillus dissolubilis TaxID=1844116 RepID=UPI001115F65E|nr:hypothetical protein [Brevibacillus dissolubilis]
MSETILLELVNSIKKLDEKMDQGFREVRAEMKAMKQEMAGLQTAVHSLTDRVTNLETQMSTANQNILTLQIDLLGAKGPIEELRTKNREHSEEFHKIHRRLDAISKQTAYLVEQHAFTKKYHKKVIEHDMDIKMMKVWITC